MDREMEREFDRATYTLYIGRDRKRDRSLDGEIKRERERAGFN